MIESKLSRKVLLLNNSYQPLCIISAKKAVIMFFSKKIDLIEKSTIIIHSEKISFILPTIVKLNNYVKIKNRNISLTRKNIFKRDNHQCQYCGKNNIPLTLDHVLPKQKGGSDSWDNLVTACTKCNTNKGGKFLNETQMHLIKIPKRPNYLIYLQCYVNDNESWKPYLYMK